MMKKLNRKIIGSIVSAVLLLASAPIHANNLDLNNEEVVKNEELTVVNDNQEIVEEKAEEVSDETKEIVEDTEVLTEEKEVVSEDEKVEITNNKTSRKVQSRARIPKEDFVLYPDFEVETPRENIKYGDVITHTITGLDMAFAEGDFAPDNAHGLNLETGTGSYSFKNTNYEFYGLKIPEIHITLKDGTETRPRVAAYLTLKEKDNSKEIFFQEIKDLEKGGTYEMTRDDIDKAAADNGFTDYYVDNVGFNIGSEDPTINYTGEFYRSEYPEGVEVSWLYEKNENATVYSDYDKITYVHKFGSEKGGLGLSDYIYNRKVGFVFTATADLELINPDTSKDIKIGEEFVYKVNVKNESNVASRPVLVFPAVEGLEITKFFEKGISWSRSGENFVGITENAVAPGDSFSTEITVLLNDDYVDKTFQLNLCWGSYYANGEYAMLLQPNETYNINHGTSTINFETNGGLAMDSIIVNNLETMSEPELPTKEGYDFVAWFKDSDLTTEWDFATDIVKEDITLYAKWELKEVEPSITVKKITIDYKVGDVISEEQFLSDIGAQVVGQKIISTNFSSVDFSVAGEYKVTLKLVSRAAVDEIEVTVVVKEVSEPNVPTIPDEDGSNNNHGTNNNNESNNNNGTNESKDSTVPKTGVASSPAPLTILVSGLAIIMILKKRRKLNNTL